MNQTNNGPADKPRYQPPTKLLPFWTVTAAFGTYFCMYAFRKPFTSASYSTLQFGGMGFKTILVTSQVFGYMMAKFIGIKIISEMQPEHRSRGILRMIIGAEAALILFAFIPPPFNAVCLFLNGLSLGMVFGLVLGYLEGRRQTEALAAGLCASFILADGITKSVGGYVMQAGVPEMQMPAASGLIFLIPTFLFVWMLSCIPAPDDHDKAARNERGQMTKEDRARFFRKYAGGLVPLMFCYLLITILRSMRADFAPELWKDLGTSGQPAVFTQSEFYVTLFVMLASGMSIFIKNNRVAFLVSLGVSIFGSIFIVLATFAWVHQIIDGFGLMVALGLGLYLPYVAIHTTVFERFLALTRDRGNVGYLMYLADSFGYLGYVAIMLLKNFSSGTNGNMADFYLHLCIYLGLASVVLLLMTIYAFRGIRSEPAKAALETI